MKKSGIDLASFCLKIVSYGTLDLLCVNSVTKYQEFTVFAVKFIVNVIVWN